MRKSIRNTTKRLAQPLMARWMAYYYRRPRRFRYKNVAVTVHPDVFPPKFTLSTAILLKFIDKMDLNGKSFLELGCGSGIVSLLAASKGARVMATDINRTALQYLEQAATEQGLEIDIRHSDLFSNLDNTYFDHIVINPPYYPKEAVSVKEQAWFCGPEFEYFQDLFVQLSARADKDNVWMILSEDCDLGRIQQIAAKNHIALTPYQLTSKLGERNTIYSTKR